MLGEEAVDEELVWFTGEEDYERGMEKLRAEFCIPLILLSLGKEGSRAYCGEEYAEAPAFYREDTIETTGAGRNFKVYFGIKVCYNVPV